MKLKRILTTALVTMALGMLAACGSSHKSSVNTELLNVEATVNADGTATTGAVQTISATTSSASISIPATTTITPAAGQTIKDGAKLVIKTPKNGTTSGVPAPTGATFVLDNADGAVDLSIEGITTFSTDNDITINIPVKDTGKSAGDTVVVSVIKGDGTQAPSLTGTYTSATNVKVDTKNFCWFIVNAQWKDKDGKVIHDETGATGGTDGGTTED